MEKVPAKLYNSNLVRLLFIQVTVFLRHHVLYMHEKSKRYAHKLTIKSFSNQLLIQQWIFLGKIWDECIIMFNSVLLDAIHLSNWQPVVKQRISNVVYNNNSDNEICSSNMSKMFKCYIFQKYFNRRFNRYMLTSFCC